MHGLCFQVHDCTAVQSADDVLHLAEFAVSTSTALSAINNDGSTLTSPSLTSSPPHPPTTPPSTPPCAPYASQAPNKLALRLCSHDSQSRHLTGDSHSRLSPGDFTLNILRANFSVVGIDSFRQPRNKPTAESMYFFQDAETG